MAVLGRSQVERLLHSLNTKQRKTADSPGRWWLKESREGELVMEGEGHSRRHLSQLTQLEGGRNVLQKL